MAACKERGGRESSQYSGMFLYATPLSGGQAPADGTKANVAGVEVKDIYLPVGQIYVEFDITDNLSLGAYSQWEWKKTEIDSVGSYFSTSDLIDEGGETLTTAAALAGINQGAAGAGILAGLVDPTTFQPFDPEVTLNTFSNTRTNDVDASDSGQWGVAFNYFAENIGEGVDFGLFYLNYHEKEPKQLVFSDFYTPYSYSGSDFVTGLTVDGTNQGFLASTGPLPTNYRLEYFENIKLIGASFSTNIGETNIGGEIHQKKGATIVGANGVAIRGDTLQYQLSAIHSLGVTSIADDIILTGEIGYNEVTNLEKEELNAGDELSGSGMAGKIIFSYNNVMTATNLSVPVSFKKNFEGHSAAGNFIPQLGDKLSVGAELTYKDNLTAGVSYNGYFGSAEDNAHTDRDFVSLNLKYSF